MTINYGTPTKKGGRAKRLLAVSATAVIAGCALAIPALAATPPNWPHDVTVFPQRDMVTVDGYAINTDMNITVNRGNKVVGRASGTTDKTGFIEVNHPGGVCWGKKNPDGTYSGVTPDIQPQDVVTVNPAVGASDSSRVINATAEAAFINADGNVEVHGTAQNAGKPINLDLMEQRIVQPDLRDHDLNPNSRITKRDIRADGTGGVVKGIDGARGDLSYDTVDNPTGTKWTAIYTGLNPDEAQLAVEGQTRILSWMQTNNAGERLGLTIYEEDEVNGPGMGGCPAGPGPVVAPKAPDAPILYDEATDRYNSVWDAEAGTYKPVYDMHSAEGATPQELEQMVLQGELHEVVTFSERDMVVAEGYAPGTNIEIVVRRPNVNNAGSKIIGSTRGVTGRDGLFEVNHPGGGIWTGQTPNIKPGDIVDVLQYNDNDPAVQGDEVVTGGETQRTMDVTAEAAFINAAGNVQIDGTAVNPNGTRIPLDQLEQRIINPDFTTTSIGRRDIRATSEGGRVGDQPASSASLRYVAKGQWRAVYTGLTGPEKQLALEGQTRIMSWLSADTAGDRFGLTIFEVGETGGPGMGGASPAGNESLPVAP